MSALSRLRPIALWIAVTTFSLVLCFAGQNSQVAGKWNMVSLTPDGDQVAWTLSIANNDGKYSGTVDGTDGQSPAKDLKVEGSKIHLRTTYQDEDYDIDLKLDGDKLTGTWAGNGSSGETRGTKAPTSPAAK